MIDVKDLSKHFGALTAVDGLSFSVQPGEVLGFLGPNGAGKSTTMKMITGFLAPDAGTIAINGCDVWRDPLAVKRHIGYLPEGVIGYEEMSVRAFLNFIGRVREFRGAELQQRIERMVEQLHLQSVINKPIESLSKGFKRRVGLAQALLHDPDILILDEPTDGLDPNQKHQVREIIRHLGRDKIVIISTHILEEVEALCQRAIIINQGKLVADKTPIELQKMSAYYQAVHLYFQSSVPDLSLLLALSGVQSVEIDSRVVGHVVVLPKTGASIFDSVFSMARQQKWQLQHVAVDPGRLDDVFRQLTTAPALELTCGAVIHDAIA